MSAGLKYTLMVTHPDTYASVAVLAGQPVPDWAEGLVHVDDFADASDAPAGAKGQPEPQDEDPDGDTGTGTGGEKTPSVAELKAEIATRNEGREEADQITPASTKKADLIAALAADQQS